MPVDAARDVLEAERVKAQGAGDQAEPHEEPVEHRVQRGPEPHEGEGHEDGYDDECDRGVDPGGQVADRVGHVTLEVPPHEGLDELVHAEDHRQRGQGHLVAGACLTQGVDTDAGDHQPCGQVHLC